MGIFGMRQTVVAGVAGAILCAGALGEEMPQRDKQMINQLLDELKQRKDMTFIREDKRYDAKTAAWYLRYKWNQNKDRVHSVQDFINLESQGGEHGEITYYVQFADGRREPAKKVFEQAFQRLEGEAKE